MNLPDAVVAGVDAGDIAERLLTAAAVVGAWTDGVVSDPKLTIAAAGVLVAIAVGLVTWRNSKTTRASFELSRSQEARKRLGLQVEYIQGMCLIGPTHRDYLFELIIRNPADASNSIGDAELLLDYEMAGKGLILKVRATRPDSQTQAGLTVMTLPITLGANESQVGTLHFRLANEVLAARSVERLRLELTDTFLNKVVVSTEMLQERVERSQQGAGSED